MHESCMEQLEVCARTVTQLNQLYSLWYGAKFNRFILDGLDLGIFTVQNYYTQTFVARANIGRAAYNKCDDAFYSRHTNV